ncbi:MAG: molecular chaperone Hsp33 [Alphaproteobacteria bacterium]|nr:molecular chaperone Hsp33 [Alphaproteobacteria bacterium]
MAAEELRSNDLAVGSTDSLEDLATPFQVADTAVRGRVVRLAGAIDRILSAHAFPDGVSELVGEAAVFVAAMGSSLKFDGKLILQINGDGPARMVLADLTADGALRATAGVGGDEIGVRRGLSELIGEGRMMLTVDQGTDMERYQGVTQLEGADLATAAEFYFRQSEQIPTVARFAVGRLSRRGAADVWRAGGIIAQFVPSEGGVRDRGIATLQSDAEREIWARAEAFVRSTQSDELIDPDLSVNDLLFRLFHEDGVRVFDPKPIKASCSCNAGKIEAVLKRYSRSELQEMTEADGSISVVCEFCRTPYRFDADGREIGQ